MLKGLIPRRPRLTEDATKPRPEVLLLQQRITELQGIHYATDQAAQMYAAENARLRDLYVALLEHTNELMSCQSILRARQLHQSWKSFREQATEPLNDISETPNPEERKK